MMSGILTFAVVIGGAIVFGAMTLAHQVEKPGPLQADKIVMIPKTGTTEIARLLEKEGVIDSPVLFELFSHFKRVKAQLKPADAKEDKTLASNGQLKAGEFLFRARTSVDEAIDILIGGRSILHSITVPEGLTSEQIIARLRENEVLTGDVNETPREGSLMPDTYKFDRGTTRQKLVNDMQTASRQALERIWSRRSPDLPIRTAQELVILASIVEKETGIASERRRVAGVFINRLQRRMKLQSDPTIVYGLVGGKGTLGRGITRAEIDRPTPYNTYVIEGLPPSPIANPGRAALEAAANPQKTRELFFVADGSGGHAFAETLDQHNRNVARWRQIERSRGTQGTGDVDRVAPVEQRTEHEDGTPSRTASTGRAFDASEGTARDPLLNRSWDLSSPKTVPSFGPEIAPEPTRQETAQGRRGRRPAAQGAGRAAEALPPGVRMPPR